MLKVFYYYYYLFYKRVLKEEQPHFNTYFSLSASIGFLVNGVIDFLVIKYFCVNIDKWYPIGVFCVILSFNYWIFDYRGLGKKIVDRQPTLFNSKRISIVLTIVFFVITVSWLFWGPFYSRYLLENCI